MARLVAPAEFGLLAGALVGVQFISYLSRFGFGSVVVQRAELGVHDRRVAFTLSLIFGIVAAAATVMVSGLVARLLDLPDVRPVMSWMAVAVALGAIMAVPDGLLRREMRFALITAATLGSTAVGYLAVGIPLAVRGWGVWSLVAATTVQTALQLLFLLTAARKGLRPTVHLRGARSMLSFGGWVAGTGLLEFIGSNVDTFAIGRWLGAAQLGQYSRATSLIGLPIEQATTATSRVLLPSFASVQADDQRFSAALLTSIGVLASVVAMVLGSAVGTAQLVVRVVLGEGWTDAGRVLPYVGVAYALSMVVHVPAVAAEARALVRLKFAIQAGVVAAFLVAVSLVMLQQGGLVAFGLAWVAVELLRFGTYMILVIPKLSLGLPQVLARYGSAAVIALVAWGCSASVVRLVDAPDVVTLLLAGLAGVAGSAGALMSPLCRVTRADGRWILSRLKASTA